MAQEFRSGSFWRAAMAEFVGMTLFIFIGLASAVGNKNNTAPDQEVKVALAFGLAIATLAQSLGHISGAHLNPAITLGMVVSCQISALKATVYVVAQMLGAVLASGIMSKLTPEETSLGVNSLADDLTPVQGLGIEFLATFQLVLCVLATTDNRRKDVTGSAPLAIGLSVGLGHLAAISYTGCGINPARSFGPAVIRKTFKDHWVYWVGPLLAGVAASLLYDFMLQPHSEPYSKRIKVLRGEVEVEESGQGTSQWPRQ
ncbi:aquaporin-1a.2 [Salminus brasiliensis]|uniref:aquaporin-1a.2 n=1 Tax=Salminus brasiliensis TaxID=930266 RepID=UPI003B83A18A